MNSHQAPSAWLITLPVIAIGASTAERAQSKYFDGAYKGTLESEQGGAECFVVYSP
jgi:hypothetical protein